MGVAETDIVNRALSEIGGRVTIVNLATDKTTAAVNARLHYDPLRQQLIRCAPWGFTRKTIAASELGNLYNGSSPYPWQYKYAYPPDCLKMRYTLPPPPPGAATIAQAPQTGIPVMLAPWSGPRRDCRYVVANDDTTGIDTRVILSNVNQAMFVYNKDVEDPEMWDPEFTNAMVLALSNKLVVSVTGNVGLKATYAQFCDKAIIEARISDGNEAIATTDHEPDWITARGAYSRADPAMLNMGMYRPVWENMNWGA